jgi:hypothetical protein
MLHLLPGWGNATFVTGEQWLTFWDRVVPEALRPWLATATLPILTIPPTLVGFLLWWRAAPTSRGAQTRRHPLERRASQAVIAYFSLLVPPMLPFTAYGWVAGLREYASADLFRARAPRTVALMTGTVALTGALLALWQIPYLSFGSFPGTPMFDYLYTGAQWAAQSGWTDRLLAPWYISLVSPYDQAAVGAYLGATAQVAAVAGACLLLGGYGYVRYNGTIATLLVILSVPSATVALFAVFAYGFLGQYWFVDVAYALVAAFYIRHRLRNRRRTRPGGTT